MPITADAEAQQPLLLAHPVDQEPDQDDDQEEAKGRGGFPQLRIVVEGGQSSLASVFTLCNSAIGAGVLALPYALRCAGLLGGAILCAVSGVIMGFTLFVLCRFTQYYLAHSYQGLVLGLFTCALFAQVRRALGKKTALGTATILALYLFGGCVAYLIIIGDTFAGLSLYYFGEGWFSDRRYLIAIIGTVIVLPMCYPKRLGALAAFSAIAVAGFLYTSAVVLFRGVEMMAEREKHWHHVKLFNWHPAFLNAIPLMVFGYQCHTNVVTIYQELAPDASFSQPTTKPRVAVVPVNGEEAPPPPPAAQTKLLSMRTVVALAIFIIMSGYLAVGIAGYVAYPTEVASNVLNTFPPDDPLMQVARLMIGVVVITHYPVNHHPARTSIEDLLRFATGWPPFKKPWRYLQTTIFWCISIVVAIFVSDLGTVIHLIGGTAAGILTLGMPGMLLINSVIDIRVWVKTGDRERAQELQRELLQKRGCDPDAMPRYTNSWFIGVALVAANAFVFILTIWTTFYPLTP